MNRLRILPLLLLALAVPVFAATHPNLARGFEPEKAYAFDEVGAVNLFNGNLNVPITLGRPYQVSPLVSYGFTLFYGGNNWKTEMRVELDRDENGKPIVHCTGDIDAPCGYQEREFGWSFPHEGDNAGFGWRLNFGTIDEWQQLRPKGEFSYRGPDGSTHAFFKTLHDQHAPEIPQPDVYYTRDGSYLRAQKLESGEVVIEFPDGTKHVFSGMPMARKSLGVTRIEDAFGNKVEFDYDYHGLDRPADLSAAVRVWKISDSNGIVHWVSFKRGADYREEDPKTLVQHEVVDRVRIQTTDDAAGNKRWATWTLHYENEDPVPPAATPAWSLVPWPNSGFPPQPDVPTYITINLLKRIDQPDGTSYQFDYVGNDQGPAWDWAASEEAEYTDGGPLQHPLLAAILKSIVMPTGGEVRWDYCVTYYPPDDLAASVHKAPKQSTEAASVRERRLYAGGTLVSRRNYVWVSDPTVVGNGTTLPQALEKHVTIHELDPATGLRLAKSQHFHMVCSSRNGKCTDGAFKGEYSLPYTRKPRLYNSAAETGGNRFLSSITYGPDNNWTTPLTLTYLRYEADMLFSETAIATFDYNRRVVSQRAADWIGGAIANCVNDNQSRFDGLGHYRVTTRTTDCAETGPGRVSTTLYNESDPDGGLLPLTVSDWPWTTHQLPVKTAPWILNAYSRQSVEEGSSRSISLFGFDPSNGLLLRKRTLVGSSPGSKDSLTEYTYENGRIKSESSYGGDAPNHGLPGGNLATMTLDASKREFRFDNEYERGVLKRSWHVDPATATRIYDIDVDLDNSGMPIVSRDVSGIETRFSFDEMGRLTGTSAPGRPVTDYVWDPVNRRVSATGYSDATMSEILTESIYDYDRFGRLTKIQTRQADGLFSDEEHTYDALGRRKTTSVLGRGANRPVTAFVYDALGRTLEVTSPDDSKVSFAYTGSRLKTRTQLVWDGEQDVQSQTTEETDGFGRLIKVTEPSGESGAAVTTEYGYTATDRLASVRTTTGTVSQPRDFVYDGRGLLDQESHPESGATSYDYDSRGHVLSKRAADSKYDLDFVYDPLERLRTVSGRVPDSATQWRPLKEFTYAAANANDEHQKGKLTTAVRYNYPVPNPPAGLLVSRDTVKVTETYHYGDVAGRKTSRDTAVESPAGSTPIVFSQSLTYTPLDQPATVTYPLCNGCGIPAFGSDTVTMRYRNGRLQRIDGLIDDIIYSDNGMWATRKHANGVTDVQVPDPSGMSRPLSIGVERCSLISMQPRDAEVDSGMSASFTVGTTTSDVTFAWFQGERGDETHKLSSTTGTLTIGSVTATTSYWCKVTKADNSCSENSIQVTASVCSKPAVLQPAADATQTTVEVGTPQHYEVIVSGSGVTYEWFKQVGSTAAVRLAGQNGPTLDFTPDATGPVVLTVKVGNACGTTSRVVAQLNVVTGNSSWPCVADFQPGLFERYATINPNEQTDMDVTAILKRPEGTPEGAIPPYDITSYSFRWYQDGDLAQSNLDVTSAASKFYLRFTGQTFVRIDATITCRNKSTGTLSQSPVATSKAYGIQWDHCPVPEIFINPADVSVAPGQQVTIVADVPYPDGTYQWYEGESGNTSVEAYNGRVKDLVVTAPGTYWLRVSTDCGTHNDSRTVTVSSATCSPVRIVDDPDDRNTDAGAPVELTVGASSRPSPNYYLWFQIVGLDESGVRDSREKTTITVRPIRTTDYYVAVGNDCSYVRSRKARVHVTSCTDINIIQPPADASVFEGQMVDLNVQATSVAPLRYRWYRGESGDTSAPVDAAIGSGPTLHLANPTSGKYWVRLSFDDATKCQVDSRTATVTVCSKPVVTNAMAPDYVNTVPRQRRVLNVGVTGENLTYQWYEGQKDDTSRPLLSTSSAAAVWPVATTTYWVHVKSGSCPATATDKELKLVTTVAVCPDFDGPPTAAKTLVNSGETTTLSASVDRGDSVEWYMIMPAGTAPQLIGTGLTVTTPPITAKARFYAVAKSGACTINSGDVYVDICSGLSVQWAYVKTQVERDELVTLTATTNDGPVSWQFYEGTTAGDVAGSRLVHTSSNTMDVRLQQTTSYWVRITKGETGCYANSSVFTVNVCVPKITTQPQSVMIEKNTSTRLTAAADLPDATWKWYIGQPGDTTNQAGTGPFLDVSPAVDTTYWARVTGCVSRDTAAATVSICKEVAIDQHPQSVSLTGGGTTIGVVASGTDLTYQWYEGSSGDTTKPLTGKTAATLDVAPAVTTNYWVRVSGRCGPAKNSNTAKVSLPPSITTQPAGGPITKGLTRTLTVAATGTELSYQWYQRTGATPTLLTGATATSYTTPQIQADSTYFVRVNSGNTWKDSNDAVLTVCLPRTISVVGYPTGISGSSVTLQVDNAAADEQFEWYQGSTLIGTGTTKTVSPLETTQYWVRTRRSACDADSPAYTVKVCIPKIDTQPQGGEVNPDVTKTLTVAGTGTQPLTYQWYRGASGDTSAPIGGATTASYTIPANTASSSYWARISSPANAACSLTYTDSNAASVTLCARPSISAEPVNTPLPASGPATLSVTASGTNLGYQWYEGAAGVTTKPVPNGTAASVNVQPSVTTNYWVRVTGNCGTKDSAAAKVSVRATIQSQPAGGVVTKGETRILSVTASGTELSYQWYQRSGATSTLLTGATATSYTTPALQADATYFCRVRSGYADVDTNDATFTVCLPHTIRTVNYPSGKSGSDVILAVDNPVAGESYEWYTGQTGDVSNKFYTGTQITVRPLATTRYWARTKRTGCDADSPSLLITICTPNITTQPVSQGTVSGTGVVLTVAATGTGTLRYQWYRGASGDTSSIVTGATSASYSTDPAAPTTSYWCRVSAPDSGCASNSADSAAALVTVCQKPVITTQPQSNNIPKNALRTLQVVATGENLHYQWYEGASGDTSKPVGYDQSTFDVYGLTTRQFWVRVSNTCGYEDSVTTLQSVYPTITQQPVNPCGNSMTMYVKATGADSYVWYRKYNNVTEQIGTGPSVTTAPPGVPVEYWVNAVSGNAATRSDSVYVTQIKPAPTLNSFTYTPYNSTQWTIAASVATAERPYVAYRFYIGSQGDTSNLVVDSSQSYKTVTPPYRPIKYWVRVYFTTGGCYTDAELTIP